MQRSGDTYTVSRNSGTPISGAYTTLSKTYTLGTGIRCPSYRKSNEGTSEVRLTGVRLTGVRLIGEIQLYIEAKSDFRMTLK